MNTILIITYIYRDLLYTRQP